MEYASSFILILFSFLVNVIGESSSLQNKSLSIYEETKKQFGKVLSAIANMNEKRLNALKKYTELDDYNPSEGILRDIDHNYRAHFDDFLQLNPNDGTSIIEEVLREMICSDGSSKSSAGSLLYTHDQINKHNANFDKNFENDDSRNDDDDESDEFVDTGNHKEFLRGLCTKEAIKGCQKACKQAAKSVCSTYKCRSSMKDGFKEKCKSECKNKISGKDSDSRDSSDRDCTL